MPKTQSDPYSMMVLNFVAKLKDVTAQLMRRSEQPHLLLQQSVDHALVAPREPLEESSAPGADRTLVDPNAAALTSVGPDQEEASLAEESAPEGSVAEPDEEADEEPLEEEEADPEAEEDAPEPDPGCTENDCSDLFAANSSDLGAPELAEPNQPPAILVAGRGNQPQVPKYQVPVDEVPPLQPVGSNELFPLQHEFIERQVNSAGALAGSTLLAILPLSLILQLLTLLAPQRYLQMIGPQ